MSEVQMRVRGRETGGGELLPASVEKRSFASVSLLLSPESYSARGDLSIGYTPDRLMTACAHPGYVELAGSWSFDATPNPSVVCDNGTVPLTLAPRQLHSLTVSSDNQVREADLTDPAGIHHHYTYTFDTRGALASKTDTITSASTTYSYDVFGNLRSVGLPDGRTITYAIDAAQRRVGKAIDGTTVQAFLYQSALQPVAELDASGQARRLFVYADKANVPAYVIQAPDAGQLSAHSYRIITDHLGSVRLVVDASDGTIMQRMDYDEHGNVLFDYVAPDFERVPFGYAGGLYDPDTGTVRFGARDYDPEIGRWTARDPIGFGGGDGNLYAYAAANPANRTDSRGTDVWIEGPSGGEPEGHESINVGDPFGNYDSYSYTMTLPLRGEIYEDVERGGPIERYLRTTPEQDKEITRALAYEDINSRTSKGWFLPYTCRAYSHFRFERIKRDYGARESLPPHRKSAPRSWYRRALAPVTWPFPKVVDALESATGPWEK